MDIIYYKTKFCLFGMVVMGSKSGVTKSEVWCHQGKAAQTDLAIDCQIPNGSCGKNGLVSSRSGKFGL